MCLYNYSHLLSILSLGYYSFLLELVGRKTTVVLNVMNYVLVETILMNSHMKLSLYQQDMVLFHYGTLFIIGHDDKYIYIYHC